MGAIVVAALVGPGWPEALALPLRAVGAVAALAGVLVGIAAGRALGDALTPFPRPARSAALVERGPYRVVRHPIYAAGLLFFCGLSLVASPAALLGTAALAVLWALKAAVEERFLLERYPGYAEYVRRVRYRLLPRVY
jgi:protein-S-isoprenylcysteine O-methyltransferase Ste14